MKPIVFLGPSLDVDSARRILDADYRPPIRRTQLGPAVAEQPPAIAIVDGEFGQSLAVSVVEIRQALRAGMTIFGSSSMGALRAAECEPLGMRGVGMIFRWYRSGAIDDDDEVALTFDGGTGRPLTEPLVNIRWALMQASACGAVTEAEATALLADARRLPYHDRSYEMLARTTHASEPAAAERLRAHVARDPHAMDRKRLDATEMLGALAASLR